MYFVYAVLAFAEFFILVAAFFGALALAVRGMIRACCKLKNKMKKPQPQCAFSRASSVNPCWLQCPHRLQPGRT
jgi:hypothetical protein